MTTMTNGSKTATVETLTAEVRVLMVGSRQVTLSVARQLDRIGCYGHPLSAIEPFGRVKTGTKIWREDWAGKDFSTTPWLELIGRSRLPHNEGALVIFVVDDERDYREYVKDEPGEFEAITLASQLPLIVLAGLR